MKLLLVLIALWAEYQRVHTIKNRSFNWLDSYQAKMDGFVSSYKLPNIVHLLYLLLPISLGVFLVAFLLDSIFWGILGLVFNLLVLWYCFGPRHIGQYLPRVDLQQGSVQDESELEDLPSSDEILWQMYESIFAILFWFMLLGPVGAVTYRVVELLSQSNKEQPQAWLNTLLQLHGLMAWVPVRLTALSYAICGNFEPSFAYWRQTIKRGDNKAALVECGMLALCATDDETCKKKAVSALGIRALYVWVFIIALLTVGGILF